MSNQNADILSPRLLVAITACWFLAQMGYYAQAQLFGPLMERFDLDEAAVGLMMSQEVMAYAFTALLMAGPVTRMRRSSIALVGAAVVLVCNIISGLADNFEVLRFARIFAGFGAGMIGAAGTASAASSANPQKAFAIISVTWGLIAAVQPFLIPYLTVPYGAAGGYFGLAAAVVLIAPICIWLPAPRIDPQEAAEKQALLNTLPPFQRFTEKLGVRGAPHKEFALIAMAALFIYEIGQGAIQVFLEQFGLRSGMEEIRIGQVLGTAAFLGLIGGVVAAWLADRYGNLRPALIGIFLNTVVAASMALWQNPLAFAVLYFAWNASFYFVVPYILGIMADMDTKGRWAVATDAIWWFGTAPGPAVGGYVVASSGYPGLAVLTVFVGLVSIVMFRATLTRFYAREQKV